MEEVYIDVMFAFNFAVDLILFYITLGVANVSAKSARVALGAAVGALGTCLVFFAPPTLSLVGKAVTVLASGAVVFGKRKPLQYLKLFALLLCITFAFGGGVYAVCAAFGVSQNGVGYMEIPVLLFAVIFGVLYLPIKLTYKIFNRKKATEKKTVTALVRIGKSEFTLSLLSDTGSTLKEPISGRYVMLVDGSALTDAVIKARGRGAVIVPFVSAGNPNGILSGIFADSVTVEGRTLQKTVIAPVEHRLSQNGEFDAVISSEALLYI